MRNAAPNEIANGPRLADRLGVVAGIGVAVGWSEGNMSASACVGSAIDENTSAIEANLVRPGPNIANSSLSRKKPGPSIAFFSKRSVKTLERPKTLSLGVDRLFKVQAPVLREKHRVQRQSVEANVLALYDIEERRDVQYFDAIREATPTVVRHRSRVGGRGFVIYWDLKGAEVGPFAREQIAHFASAGQDFEWKVYDHDAPASLGAQLQALGFEPEPKEAIVCLDLSVPRKWLASSARVHVERVTDPKVVEEIIALKRSVKDEDLSYLASSLTTQLLADGSHFGLYVVRAEGKVVSIGWARFDAHSSFASLWGGTTAPAWRNRGLYTALVATRASEAVRRGYRYLPVDALPTSRPILEKLGFKVMTYACGYVWRHKPDATSR